ncbi:hypothetical protein B0H34DRAFT_863373 [Crassisporium funariophilum]|nr:hypothetical protein B0H34DRAFT_863373 [Crassisporium funariophilum]
MAFTNISSASTMAPVSITQAINFLTRPLILTQSPDMIISLQMILRTTLQAVYLPARAPRITLSLSTSSLPPRPIYAACIACGIQWSDWIKSLGARDFNLIIQSHTVSVTYVGPNPQSILVWSEPILTPANRSLLARLNFKEEAQVPISKLGQQSLMQASLRATVSSALARAQTRTLAQQLLESDHKEEADEIFDMISKTAILSPTPTRERFSFDIPTVFMPSSTTSFPSPLSSPEGSSSDSSRPSSRSSTFSTFSFSDDESTSSASSANSFDFLASTKAQSTHTAPAFALRDRPAVVPRTPRVFIDNAKKDVTKYLYQGGVSTTLTGGVMLGGPAAAAPKVPLVPKYRAPVGGKKLNSISTNNKNASSTNSWRRLSHV